MLDDHRGSGGFELACKRPVSEQHHPRTRELATRRRAEKIQQTKLGPTQLCRMIEKKDAGTLPIGLGFPVPGSSHASLPRGCTVQRRSDACHLGHTTGRGDPSCEIRLTSDSL